MTPDERQAQDRRSLETDLKARGVIKLSLQDEIKAAENFLRDYAREQERDPRAESVDKEQKRFQAITIKFSEDVALLIKNPAFRRVCWSILEEAGMFQLSYRRGDSHESALREGRRSVGLDLLARLAAIDPGIFLQMQREHISDRKSEESRTNGG